MRRDGASSPGTTIDEGSGPGLVVKAETNSWG